MEAVNRNGPAGVATPRSPAHRKDADTVDTDKSSAGSLAQPTTDEKPDDTIEAHYACLERLEERYRHELMDDEERQETRDRILRFRRRLGR